MLVVRRLAAAAALAGALLVLVPGVALAHASFDVQQLPAGATQDLVLRVPLERDAADNDLVEVLVPGSFTVASCAAAEGWGCEQATTAEGDTVLTMQREPEGPGDTERFALTVVAPDEQGVYAFPTIQTYDDGEEAAWVGEPGSDRPAPRIQVGEETTEVEFSGDATPHTDLATPTPSASDAAAPEASPSAAAPTEPDAPSAEPSAAAQDTDAVADPAADADAGTSTVVWVLLGSLAAVAIALAVARRRRQE